MLEEEVIPRFYEPPPLDTSETCELDDATIRGGGADDTCAQRNRVRQRRQLQEGSRMLAGEVDTPTSTPATHPANTHNHTHTTPSPPSTTLHVHLLPAASPTRTPPYLPMSRIHPTPTHPNPPHPLHTHARTHTHTHVLPFFCLSTQPLPTPSYPSPYTQHTHTFFIVISFFAF